MWLQKASKGRWWTPAQLSSQTLRCSCCLWEQMDKWKQPIYICICLYIYMKKGADLLDFSKVLCGTTTTLRFGTWGIFMVMQSYTVDRSNEYDTSGMSFRPLPFFKTSIMSWLRFGIHWAGSWLCVCVWVKWPSWDLFLVSYHSIGVGLKTIDPPSWPDIIRSLFGMPLGSLSNHNRSMKVLFELLDIEYWHC